jgi:hypothetical protein
VNLGSPSAYGTSPGAVTVPGVNAFITNVPAVSQSGTWNVGLSAGAATVGAVNQAGTWTVNQGGTWNVGLSAGASTIGSVDVLGNAGNAMDVASAGAAAATNALQTAGTYLPNSSVTALTSGQSGGLRVSPDRFLQANPGLGWSTSLTAWSSATTLNSTQSLTGGNSAYSTVMVQLNQTSTLTGGAVTFEGSNDGTNWVTLDAYRVTDPTSATGAQLSIPYTVVASTKQPFLLDVLGYQQTRIRLSTVITGSGTVTPFVVAYPVANNVVLGPGSNFIGSVDTPTTGNLYAALTAGTYTNNSAAIGTFSGVGGVGRSVEQTAITNGNAGVLNLDLAGKVINWPYANRENMFRTSVSTAAGATAISFVPASGSGSLKEYAWVQCFRTDGGTSAASVMFNDITNNPGTTVTMTIASPAVVTMTNGFVAGQAVVFTTTGALPTGVTAGTTYYVISTALSSSQFEFSATLGGSAVNTSGTQSGTHTATPTGTLMVMPNNGGGGGFIDSAAVVPLVFAANTAGTFEMNPAQANVTCNARGFNAY